MEEDGGGMTVTEAGRPRRTAGPRLSVHAGD